MGSENSLKNGESEEKKPDLVTEVTAWVEMKQEGSAVANEDIEALETIRRDLSRQIFEEMMTGQNGEKNRPDSQKRETEGYRPNFHSIEASRKLYSDLLNRLNRHLDPYPPRSKERDDACFAKRDGKRERKYRDKLFQEELQWKKDGQTSQQEYYDYFPKCKLTDLQAHPNYQLLRDRQVQPEDYFLCTSRMEFLKEFIGSAPPVEKLLLLEIGLDFYPGRNFFKKEFSRTLRHVLHKKMEITEPMAWQWLNRMEKLAPSSGYNTDFYGLLVLYYQNNFEKLQKIMEGETPNTLWTHMDKAMGYNQRMAEKENLCCMLTGGHLAISAVKDNHKKNSGEQARKAMNYLITFFNLNEKEGINKHDLYCLRMALSLAKTYLEAGKKSNLLFTPKRMTNLIFALCKMTKNPNNFSDLENMRKVITLSKYNDQRHAGKELINSADNRCLSTMYRLKTDQLNNKEELLPLFDSKIMQEIVTMLAEFNLRLQTIEQTRINTHPSTRRDLKYLLKTLTQANSTPTQNIGNYSSFQKEKDVWMAKIDVASLFSLTKNDIENRKFPKTMKEVLLFVTEVLVQLAKDPKAETREQALFFSEKLAERTKTFEAVETFAINARRLNKEPEINKAYRMLKELLFSNGSAERRTSTKAGCAVQLGVYAKLFYDQARKNHGSLTPDQAQAEMKEIANKLTDFFPFENIYLESYLLNTIGVLYNHTGQTEKTRELFHKYRAEIDRAIYFSPSQKKAISHTEAYSYYQEGKYEQALLCLIDDEGFFKFPKKDDVFEHTAKTYQAICVKLKITPKFCENMDEGSEAKQNKPGREISPLWVKMLNGTQDTVIEEEGIS